MSLRRKILFKDVALLVSLLLMIAGSLWGLLRQRQHVQASLNEYTALQQVQTAQTRLVAFQESLHAGRMHNPQALDDLHVAVKQMREYKAVITQYDSILPPEITPESQAQVKAATQELVTGLLKVMIQVDPPKKNHEPVAAMDPQALSASVDQLSRQLAGLMAMCNGFVHRTELESDKDVRTAVTSVSVIAGATLLLAVGASLWQYRRIMLPLNRLRQWCRQTADGDFSIQYQPTADREFQELGRDVNRMAEALDAFTQKMESMVASKSRDLVRSERLASVGYLAAGVAHEINNPLNIMSGYAELTIKRLRRLEQSEIQSDSISVTDQQVIQHLSIIRGEAFRCKEITQKLLSLAKGNGDVREAVSVTDAVADVVTLVRGLKSIRNKQLLITIPSEEPLVVIANQTEIKQVLLNLVINAIEAVADKTGRISIEGYRSGDWIEIKVTDNGRGMSAETRERVFEPFFTNKRGAGEPGTGLGLSITHAIVMNHGGELSASSDGPDRGSRFVIRLPAAPSQLPLPRRTPVPQLMAIAP
jgi:two-component system NtrC family sensor kinase